jgi:hypothetical protein
MTGSDADAGASGTSAAAPGASAYVSVLRRNPQFAIAFAGEAVSQAGNWCAFVRALPCDGSACAR